MASQICNPCYSGGRLGGSRFEAVPGKKFLRLHLNEYQNIVVLMYHPSYKGSINRGIASLDIDKTQALSINSSTTKTKQK
jgi:hypothetical protein